MVVSQVRLFPRLLGRPGYTDRAWRHWHALRRAARQVQDLLICVEMFFAACVHQTVFSYRDFAKTCGHGGPCPCWPASRIAVPRYAARTSLLSRHGVGFCAKQRGSDTACVLQRAGCSRGPAAVLDGRRHAPGRETAQLLGANVGRRTALPMLWLRSPAGRARIGQRRLAIDPCTSAGMGQVRCSM